MYFFYLSNFLFFYRFRGLNYILKVLFLYKTNKYLKYSIFPSLNQFFIYFRFVTVEGKWIFVSEHHP